jgi:Lhr-like helicase
MNNYRLFKQVLAEKYQEETQNLNKQLFDSILHESKQKQLFKKILTENTKIMLFENILREERLQEMAQLQIKQGINHIINLIKSGVDSIKQKVFHLLTGGGKEGVLFFDENGNKVSAEQWFAIILEKVKNCKVDDIDIKHKGYTFIQVTEYKKRIEIIERQYPLIIKFARENGWSEGKHLTKEQSLNLGEKIISKLNLSTIK